MKFMIETQNLILRDFTNDDVHDYFAMDSLPIVHRYLGDNPLQSLEQAAHIIEKVRNQYEQYGIGRWTVIEKSTGKYVGWSGLKFVTEIENNRSEYYDVGYRLHPDFWGKGYATESAQAALEYGFTTLAAKSIAGSCHKENHASKRVLEKCGLRFINSYLWDNTIPCLWLEITKDEWLNTVKNIS